MGARTARQTSASSGHRKKREPSKLPIEQYEHDKEKRVNNPPVGLVTPHNDGVTQAQKYFFDPHLDPIMDWAGKRERDALEVPTVSLHVHEHIDPRSIIEAVRKTNTVDYEQMSLFSRDREVVAQPEEINFYKHSRNWSNRLVAGDSLLVMNSLIEKEGMAGKVQMIYIDPPYGIKYGSNFQPFVNKRDVKDGRDEDLNQEPETIKAFRDTWELGIHSYLSYLRDRLLLSRELLTDSGSCFVQISDENLHYVRAIMSEIFGSSNFMSLISFVTTSGFNSDSLARTGDYLVWFAKDRKRVKYHQLYKEKDTSFESGNYKWLMLPDGSYRGLTKEEMAGEAKIPNGARIYQPDNLVSQGETKSPQKFTYKGKVYTPGPGRHWKTSVEGLQKLAELGRIHVAKNSIRYVRYADDFAVRPINNLWDDTATGNFTDQKIYVVQTGSKVVARCMMMVTDPGDLVFDPTCGSGTTAYVAEQWGRRWITCDTSRVAITLAKQRLMTADYPYYKLAHVTEGVDSGFVYKQVKRVTLGALANGEAAEQIDLYDQPEVDRSVARVTGPFTVEAVPAPTVKPILSSNQRHRAADLAIVRSGETLRQTEWRDAILRSGVRAKNGQVMKFASIDAIPGTRWLHASGRTSDKTSQLVMVSFGPEHAPLEQKQVALALEEVKAMKPKPDILIFASFQFDSEAAKDIDNSGTDSLQVLKAQMNADLLTGDLKKKRSSEDSFWLVGQPEIKVSKVKTGEQKGLYEVSVLGFDYYNPVTGAIDSGDQSNIAMWMLDTDYDGQAVFPRQVFFPIADETEGWGKLAKSLKSEIDEDLIVQYAGTTSLPFESGKHKKAAVKIIDDRGIESIRIIELE